MTYIFIHQMGKVGSQTIEAYLKKHWDNEKLRRDHGLTEAFSSSLRGLSNYGAQNGDLIPVEAQSLDYQADYADESRQIYLETLAEQRPLIVTAGFREPLSFVVSNCFQLMTVLFPAYREMRDQCALKNAVIDFITEVAEAVVNDREFASTPMRMLTAMARARVLDWWQQEWLGFHGLQDKKFLPLNGGPAKQFVRSNERYYLYRIENGPSALENILADILELRVSEVELVNAAKNKPYAKLYETVRRELDFDDSIKRFFWRQDYVRELYAPGEPEEIWLNWKKSGTAHAG